MVRELRREGALRKLSLLARVYRAQAHAGELASIQVALAEIAEQRGEAQAGGLLRQARMIIEHLAERALTAALRQSFLGQARVQSVLKAGA